MNANSVKLFLREPLNKEFLVKFHEMSGLDDSHLCLLNYHESMRAANEIGPA